jgi:enoyl-CoA hydratase
MTEQGQGEVRYEIKDKIGTATISRPGRLNALSRKMLEELRSIIDGIESWEKVRVLVIRGEGTDAMAAGADLKVLASLDSSGSREFSNYVQKILTGIESIPIPVISAVDGFALGGGLEICLACDLILASTEAKLGLPETNLGIIPGWGGSIRLPRRVGIGRAKEMIFSGRTVEAQEACDMGLVDAVFPRESFEEEVMSYAASLVRKSPVSLALAKSTVLRGMDASLEAGLALEREAFAYCFSLPDAREGITAFLEKRPPRFGK